MPLEIHPKKVKGQVMFCPTFVCDVCCKPITDGKDGNTVWTVDPDTNKSVGPICYTHKACNQGMPDGMWMPLSHLPIVLQQNLLKTKADKRQALENLVRLNSIGL